MVGCSWLFRPKPYPLNNDACRRRYNAGFETHSAHLHHSFPADQWPAVALLSTGAHETAAAALMSTGAPKTAAASLLSMGAQETAAAALLSRRAAETGEGEGFKDPL